MGVIGTDRGLRGCVQKMDPGAKLVAKSKFLEDNRCSHSVQSNAFLSSKEITVSGGGGGLLWVNCIKKCINVNEFIKPVCSSDIISGKIVSSLCARTPAKIFTSSFKRLSGM